MAAPVITQVSLADEVKLRLNQVGGDLLTAAQIQDFIYRNMNTAGTWNLLLRQTGVYTYGPGGVDPIYLWFGTTPFTGTNDVEYRLNAVGPTIMVTGGTGSETATSITVTGCQVDFDTVMIDCLLMLKTRHGYQRRMTISTGSIDYDRTFDTIDKMIQDIRGAMAVG